MRKSFLFAVALLGLVMTSQAQFKGIGVDVRNNTGVPASDNPAQVVARLGLGANLLDLGIGFAYDGEADEDNLALGFSGFFLGHLHDFGPVDTYAALGVMVDKPSDEDADMRVGLFAGFQPEVTLLDHIVLGTRLGLHFNVAPDLSIMTHGEPISIVNGVNFRILF